LAASPPWLQAALGEAPPKPLLRPALRAQATRAAPEELLFQRPAGAMGTLGAKNVIVDGLL